MNGTEEALLIEYGHLNWEDIPEDVRNRIESSTEIYEAYQRGQEVQQLLSLKRHEQPDEAAEGRIQHRIRTRLENQEPAGKPDSENVPVWSWLKYALAALVIVFIGVNVIPKLLNESPNPETNGLPPGLADLDDPLGSRGFEFHVTSTNQADQVHPGLRLIEHKEQGSGLQLIQEEPPEE